MKISLRMLLIRLLVLAPVAKIMCFLYTQLEAANNDDQICEVFNDADNKSVLLETVITLISHSHL